MFDNNLKLKKGFTLTEVIITLVILGALALILVPNMLKMIPDDHNIKYKKAFYTIQEIVQDMVNDPSVCTGIDADGNPTDKVLQTCGGLDLGIEICRRLSTIQRVTLARGAAAVDFNCATQAHRAITPTTNNMNWNLGTERSLDVNFTDPTAPTNYRYMILVDVDGCDYQNCVGTARNATNGVYRIMVDNTGRVTAPNDRDADAATTKTEQQLLLDNPTD